MQYQEISLEELIHYLEDSATATARERIEQERENNPDFAEEFEGWEAFLAESNSREEGIAKMKSFSKEWTETQVDTAVLEPEAKVLQFDSPENIERTIQQSKPLWIKLAIAACVLIIAGTIISNLMQSGSSSLNLVDRSIAQEMENMLSVKAGAAVENRESFDLMLSNKLDGKQYDQMANSLDSLLNIHPEQSKYMLLQAMTYSLSGKDELAISTYSTLLKQTDTPAELTCKVRLNLARVYVKTGQKESFKKIKAALISDTDAGYICTELDATIRPSLDALSANLGW